MSQIALVVNAPDYDAAFFAGTDLLSVGIEATRLIRDQLPVGERTTLAQVAVANGTIVVSIPPTDAPDTVAGTNGVLSSAITWVKSTDAAVVAQKVELIANAGGAVLATAYVSPTSQATTLTTTAVNQKARVTAITSGGSTASALGATILPTAT